MITLCLNKPGHAAADLPYSVDFLLFMAFLASFEVFALLRNWTRWRRDEYVHQFDHNIGVGNLKDDYENGDYGFDPLNLRSANKAEFRDMQEKELNHCRLAMVAFMGILAQESLTGESIAEALAQWLGIVTPLQTSSVLDLFN